MSEVKASASLEPSAQELADKQKRTQELKVLNSELSTLKKGARVYKQQPNSGLFFLDSKNKVFSDAKRELDSLMQEYKEAEKSSAELETEQETED